MTFLTFRRHCLDQLLAETQFSGDVLDVGGKKEGRKGTFRVPGGCRSWRFVNIDAETKPDFVASADQLPLPDREVDCVLLIETLEHLRNPEMSIAEAFRVLRPGGRVILSMPFLYPVHADPHDFQRWTAEKFRLELTRNGFAEILVRPMGGLYAVLADVLESWCQAHYGAGLRLPFLLRVVRRLVRGPLLGYFLRRDAAAPFRETVNTGYYVTARKP